jgi:hypothetical protein
MRIENQLEPTLISMRAVTNKNSMKLDLALYLSI